MDEVKTAGCEILSAQGGSEPAVCRTVDEARLDWPVRVSTQEKVLTVVEVPAETIILVPSVVDRPMEGIHFRLAAANGSADEIEFSSRVLSDAPGPPVWVERRHFIRAGSVRVFEPEDFGLSSEREGRQALALVFTGSMDGLALDSETWIEGRLQVVRRWPR